MPRFSALLACLLFLAAPVAARALAPTAAANALLHAACPFTFNDSEILVEVTINGKGPFTMKLDTGSTVSLITPAVARAAGIGTVSQARTCGAYGGSVSLGSGVMGRIQLASISLYDQPCLIGEFENAIPCDGILGGAIFDRYAVQIDFAKGEIRFFPNGVYRPAPNDTCIPIDVGANHVPTCQGEIDGVTAQLEIDTGFDGTLTVLPDFVRDNDLAEKSPRLKTVTGYSLEGVHDVGVYTLTKLSVGAGDHQRCLDNVCALFDSFAETDSQYDCDGLIGVQMLSHWIVTFDYAHSQLVLH